MAIIVNWVDLCPGKRVVEAGTGSGSLSCVIANLIQPTGHLYSYEIRDQSYETANRNIKKAGLSEYVTLINKDAKLGISEKDCLLYTSPSPRDATLSRMPSSA